MCYIRACRSQIHAITHTPNESDLCELVALQERLDEITQRRKASMELGRYRPDEFNEYEMEEAQVCACLYRCLYV